MANGDLPDDLPVAELCRRCRRETARYRRGEEDDGGCCFEVFRRAIVRQDQACWTELHDIYHDQALIWCRRAGAGMLSDLEELLSLTWIKFWRYFTPDKLAESNGIAGVLGYFRACVYSVVIDSHRRQSMATSLEQAAGSADPKPTPDQEHAANAARVELWETVNRSLRDDRERTVVFLKFVLRLRSAEIQARYPDLFPSITDVYRISRNVLDRLRRSPDMKKWLEEDLE
jgi:DNA-directed RNA polymerase specialized sigma24 family protein